ncbi:MAG: AhpC/TSA family protein [Bacteroidales bacterium]|nr:AhpC/TSA family protein [Bacteroidales bacterium]
MKRFFFIMAITVTLMASCRKGDGFAITADIAGLEDGNAGVTVFGNRDAFHLTSADSSGKTIEVKDGRFSLEGTTAEPVVVRVWFKDKRFYKFAPGGGYYPSKSCAMWMIVSPGSRFSIIGNVTKDDFISVYATGDKENKAFAELNSRMMPLLNRSVNITVQMDCDATLTPEIKKRKEAELQAPIEAELDSLRRNFVTGHPSSIAGLWLMEDMLVRSQIETEALEEPLTRVDAKYRTGYFYKAVSSRVEGAKKSAVGNSCPHLEGTTPFGDHFEIESLRGKYVIIDFWGTWCGACIAGMPAMKAFRDAHADKVQIVGVAQGSPEDEWKKFVADRKLDWPNIRTGEGENDFVTSFNVQGYPTKILIGPDGTILYRASGESEEFYSELDSLIN